MNLLEKFNKAMEAPLVGETPWQEPEYTPEPNILATGTMSESMSKFIDKYHVIPTLYLAMFVIACFFA